MSFDTIELSGFAGGGEIEVACDRIDAELTALWRGIAKRSQIAVHRACLLNLVVHAGDDVSVVVARYLATSLTDRLPARVILIRARPDESGEGPPRARVAASRHPTHDGGHGAQVSGEIVLLDAAGAQLDRVPAVVRAALVPDLATTLWWTGTVAPPRPYVRALVDCADRVVVDTDEIPDDLDVAHLLPPAGSGRLADLAWPRLAPWRTAVARAFDPPQTREFLARIDAVTIGVGGGRGGGAGRSSAAADASSAPLFTGWLAAALGWRTCVRCGDRTVGFTCDAPERDVVVRIEARRSAAPGIADVALSAGGRTLRFSRTSSGFVTAEVPAGFEPVRPAAFREVEQLDALAATLLEMHGDEIAPEAIRRASEFGAALGRG